jgi:anti-anti-sigma factor
MSDPSDQGSALLLHESAAMDVRVRRVDALSVLMVTGEIDMQTAPVFAEFLDAELERQPRHLVVDLGEVTFFGSHGVRALFAATERLRSRVNWSTRLHVGLDGNRFVARTLQITGVTELVDVYPDTAALVAALRAGGDRPGPAAR